MPALTSGTFTGTGSSSSISVAHRQPFNISLWGTFSATVVLKRSFDAGVTWLPLTAAGQSLYSWTAAASETAYEPEDGVLYKLECTVFGSGTVNYRISQ
jgi:hypothetical protein